MCMYMSISIVETTMPFPDNVEKIVFRFLPSFRMDDSMTYKVPLVNYFL